MSSESVIDPSHTHPRELVVDQCVEVIERVRREGPRVHCITINVVLEFTANALLAVGAIPSMTTDPGEVGAFAASAASVLINLGTLDSARRDAIRLATETARGEARPWVMDPVMIERSAGRLEFARRLVASGPAVVRGNHWELDALQIPVADDGPVRAGTGEVDSVCGSGREIRIAAGHPLMAQVTGAGCVTSALVAAACAVESNALIAASAGLLLIGAAGRRAGRRARGSGSFRVELLDELNTITSAELAEIGRASLSENG